MDDLTSWSAAAMARAVRGGEVSCRELAAAHLARLAEIQPALNAMTMLRAEEALAEAAALDAARARGEPLGPLAGVPCTIKDCFRLAGTPTTLGLTTRRNSRDDQTAPIVRWMQAAGAIALGKANVPQLMLFMETDNPLFGRTNNPWNLARTPGGSSGGDAVAVAAGGAALGLGSDLGGSIRIPAAFTGLFGFKPTAGSLPMTGSDTSLPGFEAINTQPGPLARHAEDIVLWWEAMRAAANANIQPQRPRSSGDPTPSLAGRRFACWEEDEVYPASSAIKRAVREAAAALESLGMVRAAGAPPEIAAAFDLYLALCAAGGGEAWREMLAGSEVDRRIAMLCTNAGLSSWLRPFVAWYLNLTGETRLARTVASCGPRSAAEYCCLIDQLAAMRRRFAAWAERERIDLLLSPVFAAPAPGHGVGLELLPAAGSTMFVNLLGLPSAAAPVTRVRADEQQGRPEGSDTIDRRAHATDAGSAGLPVGVQLSATWWQDDLVLAALVALEGVLARGAEYPRTPVEARSVSEGAGLTSQIPR